jgi:hypothetical protein
VVAFRGFLRPTAGGAGVVPAEQADAYFGPAAPGQPSPRQGQGGACGAQDLRHLTPYSTWRDYYRTPHMLGNAYLWATLEAGARARVHRFAAAGARAAAGPSRRRRGADGAVCASAAGLEEEEEAAAAEELNGLDCRPAVEVTLLPLGEAAARALARVRLAAAAEAQQGGALR